MALNDWNEERSRRETREHELDAREMETREREDKYAGGSGDWFIVAGLAVLYLVLVIFLIDVLQI